MIENLPPQTFNIPKAIYSALFELRNHTPPPHKDLLVLSPTLQDLTILPRPPPSDLIIRQLLDLEGLEKIFFCSLVGYTPNGAFNSIFFSYAFFFYQKNGENVKFSGYFNFGYFNWRMKFKSGRIEGPLNVVQSCTLVFFKYCRTLGDTCKFCFQK